MTISLMEHFPTPPVAFTVGKLLLHSPGGKYPRYLQVVDPNVATLRKCCFRSMNGILRLLENTSSEPFEIPKA